MDGNKWFIFWMKNRQQRTDIYDSWIDIGCIREKKMNRKYISVHRKSYLMTHKYYIELNWNKRTTTIELYTVYGVWCMASVHIRFDRQTHIKWCVFLSFRSVFTSLKFENTKENKNERKKTGESIHCH